MRYVFGVLSRSIVPTFVLALSIGASACSPRIFGLADLAGSSGSSSSSSDTFSLVNSFAGLIYFAGGAGTSSSPYLICTRAQFESIPLLTSTVGKYFKQTCSFSMEGTTRPHLPFSFAGTYDGNGMTISDLVVDSSNRNYAGLFETIETTGNIDNLKITNAKVQGVAISSAIAQPTGVLAGVNKGGIEDITITDSEISCVAQCGGVVGLLSDGGTITRAYFRGNVSGFGSDGIWTNYGVGGIAGAINNGNIRQSFSTGTISGGLFVGGLVGFMGGNASDYLYESGTAMSVSASYAGGGGYIGGLVGYDQGSGNLHQNYTVGSLVNNTGATANSFGGLIGAGTVARDKNYAAMLGMEDYTLGGTFNANGSLSTASYFYTHAKINATNDGGALSYAQMTDSANTATNFVGMDFSIIWALPTGVAPFPFPQLRSFAFSGIHTFETTTYTPLKIVEVPDGFTTGDTFGTVDGDLGAGFVDATLTLENTSGGAITIDSASMSLGLKYAFQSGPSTCDPATVLAPAATCTLVVRLFPGLVSGVQVTDAVIVAYTDAGSIARTISHQVDATINLNDGVLATNSYTFPVTRVGTSSSSVILDGSVQIGNLASGPVVNITSIVSGSAAFIYNSGTSTCLVGSPVAAMSECTLDIFFSPSSAGWKESQITITYDGGGVTGKTIDVIVQGIGTTTMAGTGANPFEVWNAQDLAGMDIAGEYYQMTDIDLGGYTCGTFAMGSAFSGTYEGQSYKVSNHCGSALFGRPTTTASFHNLTLDRFTITPVTNNDYAGTLAAVLSAGTVSGISVTNSTITGLVAGAGGLVGRAYGQITISNSTVDANSSISVTGTNPAAAGGLVGWFGDGDISNSSSEAAVTLNAGWFTLTGAGGLVGAWSVEGNNSTITDSYSTGAVNSGGAFGGGLVGNVNSTTMAAGTGSILRSFASGNVFGAAASGLATVSQFIGAHSLAIDGSFASGNVSGGYSWGLAGASIGGAISASNSFSSGTLTATTGDALGFGVSTGVDNYSASTSITDLFYTGGDGNIVTPMGGAGDESYHYDNGVPFQAFMSTGLNAAAMENQASFTGFDFPAKWRMPVSNPFSPVNSPVPAWLCGTHGVTCY